MLQVTENLVLPDDELSVRFVHSSGPGGQNVNKVATKVELRFQLRASRVLSADVKARVAARHPGLVTLGGELVLTSSRQRSQAQNRKDAEERLAELIRNALVPPRPRHATRVSRNQKRKRLDQKRKLSDKKRARGRVSGDD